MKNIYSGLVKKLGILALTAFCFVLFSVGANAQTVLVNYDFASATAGTPCTATPLTTATGVTSTFTTGGTGGGACTTPTGTAAASPPAFVANASNQAVSLSSFAAGSTNYFQFQLSGVSAYQDYMLFFQTRRSGTGPVNVDVQYSLNGTTFTTFATIQPPNSTTFSAFTVDLSSVAAIEGQPTVYFRLLGRDGTGSTGTFVIDNFQVRAMAVSAAGATVSGRITNARGRGLGYVTVMMAGGALEEPIYATTSAFGYYQFNDIPPGETYVLTVFSKRYQFKQSSIVINVNNDFTDADFVGYIPFQ
ncbi:MAG: carboxypeptidase regulatory-like domain-containing protein [Acidobacteria bacterium]|jgi:hypothetical protein|nr:carboxypeptidase regulatory-like domain-containing protein [Acidobacteriota bacterium]